MIECTELGEEGFDGPFVRDVNCVPLRSSTNRFNRFLNSFRTARGDDNARPLRCRLLGNRQTDSRRSAQHDHPLILQSI
jgi:hypothetical protein